MDGITGGCRLLLGEIPPGVSIVVFSTLTQRNAPGHPLKCLSLRGQSYYLRQAGKSSWCDHVASPSGRTS